VTKEKRSLGESLVEDGLLTPEQLKKAQEEEKQSGQRFRKVVVRMGFISDEGLVEFCSAKFGIPRIELANYLVDSAVIKLVPEELARKHELVPVLKIGNRLTCAMVDPWNIVALDELQARTGLIIEPAITTQKDIQKALNEFYGVKGNLTDLLGSIEVENLVTKKLGVSEEETDIKKLAGIAEEPVVVRLVNMIIIQAMSERASDIHIVPEEAGLRVRFRVDGMLHDASSPPKHLQAAIVSRIKIMSNLDISERRLPQDGRFTIKIEGRPIDLRVSCVPTMFGESVVLRLLDVSTARMELSALGFSRETLTEFQKLITLPHGIILVTGPTGSGKTTVLYAALDKINSQEKNIITIEDPVEYKLKGICQMQVNNKINLTFAGGLRSILRQDPDVIMVGEARDFETAEIAIQAALTGHLVFTTLHTNDALSASSRLIDMGVEPFLISASLAGVLAQRLVRTICVDCKEAFVPSEAALKDLGIEPKDSASIKFYRGKGCDSCLGTGYKGRIGIFELLTLSGKEKLKEMIIARSALHEFKKEAVRQGMSTLRDDGIRKIKDGVTTIEEVIRVTQEE